MTVIPNEVRNLKISQSLYSFEMTTFFCRYIYLTIDCFLRLSTILHSDLNSDIASGCNLTPE